MCIWIDGCIEDGKGDDYWLLLSPWFIMTVVHAYAMFESALPIPAKGPTRERPSSGLCAEMVEHWRILCSSLELNFARQMSQGEVFLHGQLDLNQVPSCSWGCNTPRNHGCNLPTLLVGVKKSGWLPFLRFHRWVEPQVQINRPFASFLLAASFTCPFATWTCNVTVTFFWGWISQEGKP